LQLVPVRFEFTHPTAKTVCIAGTFNHWQPEAKTLHSSGVRQLVEGNRARARHLRILPRGGRQMDARSARRESVANPFGGRNSILKVASSPEAAHLADAENLPLKNKTNKNTKNMNKETQAVSNDIGHWPKTPAR
jgi:hypothetical protein